METKLLGCPFGCEDGQHYVSAPPSDLSKNSYAIWCCICGVRVFSDSAKEVTKIWNTRPSPATDALVSAEDKDCYVSPPLGQDKDFDAWEKLHHTEKYYTRVLKTKLSSERAMHKAWRKRAEEAEVDNTWLRRSLQELQKLGSSWITQGVMGSPVFNIGVTVKEKTTEALAAVDDLKGG